MKKYSFRTIISLLIVVCLCLGIVPIAAFAENDYNASSLEDLIAGVSSVEDIYGELEKETVPEIIGYDYAVSKAHVQRLYEEEGDDLNRVVFLNADGTQTAYIFDFPVKYIDERGTIKDITLDIADSNKLGQFETASGSSVTTFSRNATDGIRLVGNDTVISLVPHIPVTRLGAELSSSSKITASSTAKRIDNKTVSYDYDSKTTIEYSLTYTGFKEDIVVNEYTGQTEYDFTLYTNGLDLTEIDGSFYLVDEENVVKATLGDIIIFTADEKNNTMGELNAQTIVAGQEYMLTIVVDPEFLASEETVYPIRIDPTVEICYDNNGAGAIADVTLNSNSGSSGTSGSLSVGLRETYGVSRILMKFPGLNLSSLGNNITITNATVEIRDLMCEGTGLDVSCYVFSGNTWDESTANWSNVSPNSISTFLSSNVISYANGTQQATAHRYSFDITQAVEGWRTGNYNPNKGIIFKGPASVENGSTYNCKTIASYNRASYKPALSVTYGTTDNLIGNDTYYLNNRYCGDYLRNSSSSATATSGLISSLGNSIRWEIRSVNGGYVIRSKSDTTKYLGVPTSTSSTSVSVVTIADSTIPTRCIWGITIANGGGCLVKSAYNSKYLYSYGNSVSTSSSTGAVGTSTYDSKVWRIASLSLYGSSNVTTSRKELSSFSMSNSSISIGQPINPQMTSTIASPMWTSAGDFEYSDNDCYTRDYRTGTLTGAHGGTYTVEAKHKVTDVTTVFTITVEDSLLSASCLEDSINYIKYSVGNSSSALMNGIIWESSDTSVATVSDKGAVTGINTGYTFITATNHTGNVILMCEFQVTNERTQKMSVMEYNEIQYLYCPSTYLNLWTENLPNAFDFKVDVLYCLRAYYTLPENQQPNGAQLKQIMKNELNLTVDEDAALLLFNECYLGYRGLYNASYLNNLRKQYFNYLKEIVAFCAFSMARNLDPVNTLSNCNGYDDLVYDLSKEWGHNENSTNVMLGSNGYKGKYYYIEAQSRGYRYFYAPNYDYFYNEYGADFVRSVNIRYLQRCIGSNCTFYFCSNPATAPLTSSLHMEYSYLLNYYNNLWGTAYLKYQSGLWYFSPTP